MFHRSGWDYCKTRSSVLQFHHSDSRIETGHQRHDQIRPLCLLRLVLLLPFALVAEAHALGLPVTAWTVNETADIEAMIAAGVDGIVSDYPGRVQHCLLRSDRHWLAAPDAETC